MAKTERAGRRGLSPDEVRRLSRLSPLRAALPIVATFGWIAAAVAVAVRYPHPLVISAAMIVIATRQHALAVLMHDAAHQRLFERRWLNDFAGRLCGYPAALSMMTYRMIHTTHHNHLYEPVDPDLALMAGYPRGKLYLVKKLLKDLLGVTVFKNYRYFLAKSRAAGAGRKKSQVGPSKLQRDANRDRNMLFAFQAALLATMIVTGAWRWWLLLWVLPAATLLQVILRLRAVCEHGAVPEVNDPWHAARTTLAGPVLSWFFFPYSVNYHIEHHLYPSIPHYRLKDCHAELAKLGALEDAEVQPNIRVTLAKIFAPRLARV